MKNIVIISILFLLFSNKLLSQTVNPADTILPEKVVNCFKEKYPDQSSQNWTKDEKSNYLITFIKDGLWYDVTINPKGKWQQTNVMLNFEDLPEALRNSFNQSVYGKNEILRIDKLETPSNPEVYIMAMLSAKDEELVVKFDGTGKELTK
jgi:hypothetical protein